MKNNDCILRKGPIRTSKSIGIAPIIKAKTLNKKTKDDEYEDQQYKNGDDVGNVETAIIPS